jgi:hypothetical protein
VIAFAALFSWKKLGRPLLRAAVPPAHSRPRIIPAAAA